MPIRTASTTQFATAAEWEAENPVIPDGWLALDTDSGLSRVGDGSTRYADLSNTGTNLSALPTGTRDVNSLTPFIHVTPAVSRVVRGTFSAAPDDNDNAFVAGDVTQPLQEVADWGGPFGTAAQWATGLRDYLDAVVESIPALSVVDNGNGTFDITCEPGAAANDIAFTSEDPNLTFAQTVAGADETHEMKVEVGA